MSRVAGVDIARGAWLIVYLLDGRFECAQIVDDLTGIDIEADVVAIDVPLRLPEDTIGRDAETLARAMLGRRGSSVFASLPRWLYEAEYTPETRTAAKAQYGTSFSKQAWNLRRAVFDADAAKGETWFETHPELAFSAIAGEPLAPKKRWSGVRQRLDCLEHVGIVLPSIPGAILPDDALDAAVCAHVASKIARGCAQGLPSDDPQIWF